jgi:hypothetical protein
MSLIDSGTTLYCPKCLSNETCETGTGTETGARHTTIRCLACYAESKVRTQEIRGVVHAPGLREDCLWARGEILDADGGK